MTNVYLYGKLAQEFGREFKFSLAKPKDVFLAIDANKTGFLNRIIELADKGAHYNLVIDGISATSLSVEGSSPKEIHIIPAVCGSAGTVVVVGAIVTALGYGIAGTSPYWSAVLIAVGTAAISYGISNLMQKDQKSDLGSASATANALNKSFLFSNGENITEQGNPIPIGYGRLKIGSAVIQGTIKSFPAKFDEKNSLPIYSEFVELSTKRGLGQMAVVDRQQVTQTVSE